jgi:hypothetical protein
MQAMSRVPRLTSCFVVTIPPGLHPGLYHFALWAKKCSFNTRDDQPRTPDCFHEGKPNTHLGRIALDDVSSETSRREFLSPEGEMV